VKRPLTELEAFRAQELLFERATSGLDDAQAAELAGLGVEDDLSFDLAAAAIDIATLRIEALPPGVADKILVSAGVARPSTPVPTTLPGVTPSRTIDTRRPSADQRASEPYTGHSSEPYTGHSSEPYTGHSSEPYTGPRRPSQPDVGRSSVPDVGRVSRPDIGPGPSSRPDIGRVSRPGDVRPSGGRPSGGRTPDTGRRSRGATYAWVAAAACLVLAVGAVLWATQRSPEVITKEVPIVQVPVTPSPAEARAALLASAKDVTTLSWTTTPDPAATGASGDVVWSPSRQRGFMRFVGLAPNDPAKTQYQLWIFDKQRDERYPVDGGVFDVGSNGEVIVAISAKLPVGELALFAVTVEPPGGVVVSKRDRIVVTAAPG
jgi:hypothetical protein